MKKITILLIILSVHTQGVLAQFELRFLYNYSSPRGEMAVNVRQAHGIVLEGTYNLPKTPINVGLELSFSGYGHHKSRQTYTFDDGSQTETDVHVNNNIASFRLVTRVNFLKNGPLIPYMDLKGGVSRYFTNLRIDDPEDVDDCHPLESDILLSKGALTASAGMGLRWDLSTLFNQMDKGRFFMDFNTSYTAGTRVQYMSVNAPEPKQKPVRNVDASFINTHHQVIHKHHVGYVYESAIEMLELRVGFAARF
jgi:hypothetical protein